MALSAAQINNRSVDNVLLYAHQARDARMTALALGAIFIFLLASSYILFGLGTLSPTFLSGLGIFPYLGGAVLSLIALGVLCGALILAAIASVRTCQKERLQNVAQPSDSMG